MNTGRKDQLSMNRLHDIHTLDGKCFDMISKRYVKRKRQVLLAVFFLL
jgi:hypothetical protein